MTTLSLSMGGDARHVSRLEGLEVEEPGESRGDSREDEEEPRVGFDLADGSGLMPENHDTPRQYQDDGGANSCGEIRIDLPDADFGKDGRQSGEQGREQGIVFPHGFEWLKVWEGAGGGRVRKKCDPRGRISVFETSFGTGASDSELILLFVEDV